jgi:polysaccharide chain length determinant protein (PEP-CTERM system associated)
MQELLQQLTGHLRAMWHRRWFGLAAAWLAAIVGVVVVFNIPQRYEASARVFVDTESLLRPLLAGLAIQPNLDQQVGLISRTLVSRPNIEKLLRSADLDLNVHSQGQRDELIDSIIKRIKLESANRSNLYVITYADEDANRAQRVVQQLLSIFVESSLGDKRQDTQAAVKFLDEQIKRYEDVLRQQEDRIKEFRIKNIGLASRDNDYFTRMARLASEIDAAKLELQAAVESNEAYRREIAEKPPSLIPSAADATDGGDAISTPELTGRIEALKKDLDGLLRKYTDEHPDVVATRRLIAQLDAQRKDEVAKRQKAAAEAKRNAGTPADQNPVQQQVRISLVDSEANVAGLRAKVAGLEAQYQRLKAQAQLVPQVETEYTQLVRDYDVQKKTYDNLVGRRESAMMGKDVQETGGAQFRVIDPPRVSPTPVGPNRLLLLGGVLVVALGVGAFASLAVTQINPTFHDTRALREIAKRPILGMVSMLPSDALRRLRRRNAWLFAGGLGSLFASFAAVFAFALMFGRVA